ncbi:MAG TPA: 4Fe-4S dicluster domain-containing protein [Arenimonas sp.]|uniref:4Fe-4S dicluster domain-containing protein n=1 Tax=Arenimonas sp. TaxID=1872635 RepID=UPI002D808F20|nr:4Fe-4S dicluster domain-containing protein [Arenimonas sp.]HEU0153056.1 4Fe-4S dicluster domain-containing protein [Arenimonas sp.]
MAGKIPVELVDEVGLYVSERKVYPREQGGFFQTLRKAAVFWLLGMYYGFAWLQWDDRQAVLFDLPARKFYVFGLSFWPQDFFYLALLLIMAGLTLFFFTALAGRLWCGYACPQTVWTEVFIWMERWTEGDRNKRMKLDAAPWSRDKLLRKGSKHVLWLVFALWTGFTFVGYFTPIRDLAMRLVPFEWGGWEVFWVLFYSLATWGNAGVLREQVCKYMCPYARFQSAMFDRNTLIIAYDPMRGEPRGARKKSALASVLQRARGLLPMDVATSAVVHAAQHRSAADLNAGARATTGLVVDAQEGLPPPPVVATPEDLGDCIDCTICVQVCPTGIDIRNGLQYECIACGACVDACDSVMDKMGYPRGLIRNTTQNALDGKPSRILRPRIIVYGTLLLLLLVGFGVGIATRTPMLLDVIRDRNALYRVAADGSIENGYLLRIVNKEDRPHVFTVRIEGAPSIVLVEAGATHAAAAEEVLTVPVTLRAPAGSVTGRADLRFVVDSDAEGVQAVEETRFFGPSP